MVTSSCVCKPWFDLQTCSSQVSLASLGSMSRERLHGLLLIDHVKRCRTTMRLSHEQACMRVFLAPKLSTLMSKYIRETISHVYLEPNAETVLMQLVDKPRVS